MFSAGLLKIEKLHTFHDLVQFSIAIRRMFSDCLTITLSMSVSAHKKPNGTESMGNGDTSSLNLSVFNLLIFLKPFYSSQGPAYISMACVDVATSMADNRAHPYFPSHSGNTYHIRQYSSEVPSEKT